MNPSSGPHKTLLLSGHTVCDLVPLREYISVVEEAFKMHSLGKSFKPEMMHLRSIDGEFHIKAGGLEFQKRLFALKINADFPLNQARFGTSLWHGLIVLCNGEDGYPLAIMDSREITLRRTAAATAVATRHLANLDTDTITICGYGAQACMQLCALAEVLPIRRIFVFARDQLRASAFAVTMSKSLNVVVEPTADLRTALRESRVCVTCTRSTTYFLFREYVMAGTFIAAVGADSPNKQELDPELLMSSKLVVDLRAQCARVGELHHALARGFSADKVHAELGEVISGSKAGRSSKDEVIVFDSTGTAIQDVAASAAVYEKALQLGMGETFDFFT
jgi:alanine dehydrogenase